jgi:hypothetical protein
MIKISADQYTKSQLNLEETITEDGAKKVIERLSNDTNYKVSLSPDRLTIQRFLRD